MYAITPNEGPKKGYEIHAYATAVFGILEAPTGGGYVGETLGFGVANQFWPMDQYTDQYDYFVGPIMTVKFAADIKFDSAGQREMNGAGFMLEATWGLEYKFNHIEQEMATCIQEDFWEVFAEWAGGGIEASINDSNSTTGRVARLNGFICDLGGLKRSVADINFEGSLIYSHT